MRRDVGPSLEGLTLKPWAVPDNDAEYVSPLDMLAELREDNATLAARSPRRMRRARRCGDGEPARGVDREKGMVPLRGDGSR